MIRIETSRGRSAAVINIQIEDQYQVIVTLTHTAAKYTVDTGVK